MSYTEFHKGKLKVLTRNNKETLDYIEKNNLQDTIKECGWCDEIDFDVDSLDNAMYFKQAFYGVPVRMAILDSVIKK